MFYVTMYIICIPGLYYIIYYSYINIKICKDLSKVHLEISHTYFYVVIDFFSSVKVFVFNDFILLDFILYIIIMDQMDMMTVHQETQNNN